MATHNPQFISIESLTAARKEIQKIGTDPKGLDVMIPKAVFKIIKLNHVVLQDAIIIKQDMLSVGGEVAIPREAFQLKTNPGAILIMGTVTQLRELVIKLKRHYTRIKEIATELSVLLKQIA